MEDQSTNAHTIALNALSTQPPILMEGCQCLGELHPLLAGSHQSQQSREAEPYILRAEQRVQSCFPSTTVTLPCGTSHRCQNKAQGMGALVENYIQKKAFPLKQS